MSSGWPYSQEIGINLNDIDQTLGLGRQRPKKFRSLACDVIWSWGNFMKPHTAVWLFWFNYWYMVVDGCSFELANAQTVAPSDIFYVFKGFEL